MKPFKSYDLKGFFFSRWDVAETSDESPELDAFICESISAYICSAMDSSDNSWKQLQKDFENDAKAKARIDT